MKAVAHLRYLRIAPRKVRLLADLVRGKQVEEAQLALASLSNKSAVPVLKTLRSAVASAKNNFQAVESNLYIAKILVNEGPKLKRFRARARGAAYPIQKKTSHLTVVVDERDPNQKAARGTEKQAAQQAEEPARKTARQKPRIPAKEERSKAKSAGIVPKIFRRKSV